MSNQIELRHLRYFMAVADHLNFHRAAGALHISQPGLSRQIAQLEFHLGTSLLERDRRSVSLTAAGQYLREQLVPQLNRLANTYEQTRRIGAGRAGEIRIGFLGSAMQEVIPELLLGLKEAHPELRTSLEERSNQEQVRALMEESLDLGFVRLSDLPPELDSCAVVRETFSLVVPSGHLLTPASFRSVAQLAKEAFILFSPEYSPDYYRTVLSICEDAGFHPRISHKSVHAHTIFKLVEAGLGLAIVPTSLQHGFRLDVRFIELGQIRQRAVLTAVWKREHQNRALDLCIERLRAGSSGY
jgi:DNA-binding transcriptional LysR family regulator